MSSLLTPFLESGKNMKMKLLLFPLSLLFLLACNTAMIQSPTEQVFGFDFSEQVPQIPTGDRSAPTHLFVHKYPFYLDGNITGLTFLNDSDGGSETFILLVLRPTGDGWKVVHRVEIEGDDQPSAKTGVTTIHFENPLSVQKGDIFGHWQFDETGAIPLNDENLSVEGLSFGKFGIGANETAEGQFIQNQGFSGGRDYFINIIFQTLP